jgi:hypothetical protein
LNRPTSFLFYRDNDFISDWQYCGYEDDQFIYCYDLFMYAGYRYAFYVTTEYPEYSGFMWLALRDSSSWEHFGSDNCELCNWTGCVAMGYERDECPGPSATQSAYPTETCSPQKTPTLSASPVPSPTPYLCGISGILYSKHSSLWNENWIESQYANVSADSSSEYLSIKGSYKCESSGSYIWYVDPGNFGDSWYFVLDGETGCFNYSSCDFYFTSDYNSSFHYYEQYLNQGYRYPFYFYTTRDASATSVTLDLEDASENRAVLGSANTERCNTSYCNDVSASRQAECMIPHASSTPRATGTKGLLYTRHSPGSEEEWQETSVAHYSSSDSNSSKHVNVGGTLSKSGGRGGKSSSVGGR